MKKFFLYVLAFFLLPIYPFLRRMKKIGEKVRIGERVVVVTRDFKGKKRVQIT